MIVVGAILLILGLVFGISILTYIGVVLLVIGAVFWILGSVGRPDRRQALLVLTPSGSRPRRGERRDRHRPQDGARAGVGRLRGIGLTLCGVEFSRPKAACAISRASASVSDPSTLRSTSTQISTYWRWDLADLPLGGRRQMAEVAVLDADQVRFSEREIEVEIDEPVQRGRRIGGPRDDVGRPGQQPGADADQQLDQQGLFVREMPIDRRPTDSRGCPDILQAHCQIAALGDQPFGRRDELAAAVRFRPAAPCGCGRRGHLDPLVTAGGHFG